MQNSHASFFSGVGGMDLGLERAGWQTVSFSEIEPYACAVLAARWPSVPNIGDIVQVAGGIDGQPEGGRPIAPTDQQPDSGDGVRSAHGTAGIERMGGQRGSDAHTWRGRSDTGDWTTATLWSGGFPCQDISVAGKRAGLAGERSGLALTFLALADTFRPEWILLENVTGLLSSNKGHDLAELFHRLEESGYGWAYRVLDSQWFGVPQRRRRVFIVAHTLDGHPDFLGPGEVLAVGTRCEGHPYTRRKTGKATASLTGGGADSPQSERVWSDRGQAPTLDTGRAVPQIFRGSTANPGGVRTVDELAGRLDDSAVAYTKQKRAQSADDDETWVDGVVSPTLNGFDTGDIRATTLALGTTVEGDDLLPLGLDSHRYRVIGNGVVSNVAEWIGGRILAYAQA